QRAVAPDPERVDKVAVSSYRTWEFRVVVIGNDVEELISWIDRNVHDCPVGRVMDRLLLHQVAAIARHRKYRQAARAAVSRIQEPSIAGHRRPARCDRALVVDRAYIVYLA